MYECQPDKMNPDFQRVLALTKKIPRGKVSTYKELARALRIHPRVVAKALSSNKHPIIIPCHRVIHASGEIGGYTPKGRGEKIKLLRKERVSIDKNKINESYFYSFR